MFEQARIAVQDVAGFAQVQNQLDSLFGDREVEMFFWRVQRSKRGVRQMEELLERGVMGKETAEAYRALPVSDKAQLRERYLQQVEAAAPELRQRFYKVYVSY
jgi:hypothetical protein